MSQETNWTQRRRRLVRCKKHDLHFDPDMTSGCALCRKEDPLAHHKGPQILILLLALLGVAFAAYQMFKPRAGESGPARAPSIVALERGSQVLDPEKFRAPLMEFEAALFSADSANFDQLTRQLGDTANSLSSALRRQSSNHSKSLAEQIETLTAGFDSAPLNLARLQSTRQRWRKLRQRYFDYAPWLHNAKTARRDNEKTQLLAFRNTAEQLLDLAWEGNSRAAAGDDWATWSSTWRQRIVDLRQGMPGRPRPSSAASTLLGFQELGRSISQLLALADDPELPSRSDFEARFSSITASIQSAQASFDGA